MASTDHFLQAALDADAQKQILEAELRESLKRADELGRDAAHFDAQIRATDLTAAAAKAGLTKQFRDAATLVAKLQERALFIDTITQGFKASHADAVESAAAATAAMPALRDAAAALDSVQRATVAASMDFRSSIVLDSMCGRADGCDAASYADNERQLREKLDETGTAKAAAAAEVQELREQAAALEQQLRLRADKLARVEDGSADRIAALDLEAASHGEQLAIGESLLELQAALDKAENEASHLSQAVYQQWGAATAAGAEPEPLNGSVAEVEAATRDTLDRLAAGGRPTIPQLMQLSYNANMMLEAAQDEAVALHPQLVEEAHSVASTFEAAEGLQAAGAATVPAAPAALAAVLVGISASKACTAVLPVVEYVEQSAAALASVAAGVLAHDVLPGGRDALQQLDDKRSAAEHRLALERSNLDNVRNGFATALKQLVTSVQTGLVAMGQSSASSHSDVADASVVETLTIDVADVRLADDVLGHALLQAYWEAGKTLPPGVLPGHPAVEAALGSAAATAAAASALSAASSTPAAARAAGAAKSVAGGRAGRATAASKRTATVASSIAGIGAITAVAAGAIGASGDAVAASSAALPAPAVVAAFTTTYSTLLVQALRNALDGVRTALLNAARASGTGVSSGHVTGVAPLGAFAMHLREVDVPHSTLRAAMAAAQVALVGGDSLVAGGPSSLPAHRISLMLQITGTVHLAAATGAESTMMSRSAALAAMSDLAMSITSWTGAVAAGAQAAADAGDAAAAAVPASQLAISLGDQHVGVASELSAATAQCSHSTTELSLAEKQGAAQAGRLDDHRRVLAAATVRVDDEAADEFRQLEAALQLEADAAAAARDAEERRARELAAELEVLAMTATMPSLKATTTTSAGSSGGASRRLEGKGDAAASGSGGGGGVAGAAGGAASGRAQGGRGRSGAPAAHGQATRKAHALEMFDDDVFALPAAGPSVAGVGGAGGASGKGVRGAGKSGRKG